MTQKSGFTTKHRIQFRSEPWIVEGGIQRKHAFDIRVYRGVLIDSHHTYSHLCVLVEREDDWYRSEGWHGWVAKANVDSILFVDDNGQPVEAVGFVKATTAEFRRIRGRLCENLFTNQTGVITPKSSCG